MFYRILADLLVLIHLAFVIFVVTGALLSLFSHRWMYVHIPAVIWAALVELAGWVCPLTPMENHFRRLGGEAGYAGGFIEEHLLAGLYPAGLTRSDQVFLGVVAVILNAAAYFWVWRRRRAQRQ